MDLLLLEQRLLVKSEKWQFCIQFSIILFCGVCRADIYLPASSTDSRGSWWGGNSHGRWRVYGLRSLCSCFQRTCSWTGLFVVNNLAYCLWRSWTGFVLSVVCGGQLLDRIGPPTEDLKKKGIDFSLWFKPDKYPTDFWAAPRAPPPAMGHHNKAAIIFFGGGVP